MKFVKGSTPSNFKDMSRQRIGMLSVLRQAESRPGREAYWLCQCDCGKELEVSGYSLRAGQYSCRCGNATTRTHGKSTTQTYRIWSGMIQRCTNPRRKSYRHYGGRGITVCKRWMSFENFFADMGDCPAGHSIERIDNDLGYFPGNCRWLPLESQTQNRRGNLYIEVDGEKMCVAEASRRLGISHSTIRFRLKRAVKKTDISAPVGRDIFLTLNGETLNMKQWADRLGLKRSTISMRHKRGWPVERILGPVS